MTRFGYAAGLAAVFLSLPCLAELENYTIDPRHTFPIYEIGHLGYSLQHGRFDKTSGKITLDTAGHTGSADITVDAASVSTGVDKLDEHLRSEDFLNTAKYPLITFKSSNLKFQGDTVTSATGDLTIAGVTRAVIVDVQHFHCGPHPGFKRKGCGADLVTAIKRSDFGIKYGVPALGDDVLLRIGVEAVKD